MPRRVGARRARGPIDPVSALWELYAGDPVPEAVRVDDSGSAARRARVPAAAPPRRRGASTLVHRHAPTKHPTQERAGETAEDLECELRPGQLSFQTPKFNLVIEIPDIKHVCSNLCS